MEIIQFFIFLFNSHYFIHYFIIIIVYHKGNSQLIDFYMMKTMVLPYFI